MQRALQQGAEPISFAVYAERVEPLAELLSALECALERQINELRGVRSQKFLRILRTLEALEVLRDYVQAAVIRHCYVDYRRGIAAQRAYVDLGYRIARGETKVSIR